MFADASVASSHIVNGLYVAFMIFSLLRDGTAPARRARRALAEAAWNVSVRASGPQLKTAAAVGELVPDRLPDGKPRLDRRRLAGRNLIEDNLAIGRKPDRTSDAHRECGQIHLRPVAARHAHDVV